MLPRFVAPSESELLSQVIVDGFSAASVSSTWGRVTRNASACADATIPAASRNGAPGR